MSKAVVPRLDLTLVIRNDTNGQEPGGSTLPAVHDGSTRMRVSTGDTTSYPDTGAERATEVAVSGGLGANESKSSYSVSMTPRSRIKRLTIDTHPGPHVQLNVSTADARAGRNPFPPAAGSPWSKGAFPGRKGFTHPVNKVKKKYLGI